MLPVESPKDFPVTSFTSLKDLFLFLDVIIPTESLSKKRSKNRTTEKKATDTVLKTKNEYLFTDEKTGEQYSHVSDV
jgi:hypothetical protein